MTDTEENKLSMFMVVRSFLNKKAAELASHAKIAPVAVNLNTIIESIVSVAGEAMEDTSGYREDKNEDRKALEAAAFKCGKAAKAYALENDLVTLLRKSEFSVSTWRKMRDADFYVNARQLYVAAQAVIGDLADFRYTPADLSDYETKLNGYFEAIPNPKDAQSETQKAGQEMDQLFKDADKLLDKLDTFMDSFRFDDKPLWEHYKMSREIVNNSGRKRAKAPKSNTLEIAPLKMMAVVTIKANEKVEIELSNKGFSGLQLWRSNRKEAIPNTEKLLLGAQSLKTTLPSWAKETQIMVKNLDPERSGKLDFRVLVG